MKDSKIVELEKIVLILYFFNLLRSGKSKEKFLLAKQLFVAVTALQSKLKRAERNFYFKKKELFSSSSGIFESNPETLTELLCNKI